MLYFLLALLESWRNLQFIREKEDCSNDSRIFFEFINLIRAGSQSGCVFTHSRTCWHVTGFPMYSGCVNMHAHVAHVYKRNEEPPEKPRGWHMAKYLSVGRCVCAGLSHSTSSTNVYIYFLFSGKLSWVSFASWKSGHVASGKINLLVVNINNWTRLCTQLDDTSRTI